MRIHRGVNWNEQKDGYTQTFWNQNTKQFWLEKDIPVTDDMPSWEALPQGLKDSYIYALGGLTLLDTKQAGDGMPLIGMHETDEQKKAVFSFMGTMEHIHAKSYSRIFQTFLTREEEAALFKWVETDPYLQAKAEMISKYYDRLLSRKPTELDKYFAKMASVQLESYLFYSGFFLSLYLAGQGILTNAGEIINLIIRDESIHGVYTGVCAQDDFNTKLNKEEQELALLEFEILMRNLYELECKYTEMIYAPAEKDRPGITEQVKAFIRYNANKACSNMGIEPMFTHEEINPLVESGLSTATKIHDFFSKKGNGYFKAINVEIVTDRTFDYTREDF